MTSLDKTSQCTVLIPAYGNLDYLENALDSLLLQSEFIHLNIIISDDKPDSPLCPDDFSKYHEKFCLQFYKQTTNLGVIGNKKFLFKLAKTKYVAFLDHDDIVLPDNFYQSACHALEINNASVYYSACKLAGSGEIIGRWHNINNIAIDHVVTGNSSKLFSLNPSQSLSLFIESVRTINGSSITSWSSIVFNADRLRELTGGFAENYFPTSQEFKNTKTYRDEEWMSFILLLANFDRFVVNNEPTTIRGISDDSASKSSSFRKDGELFVFLKTYYFVESLYGDTAMPADNIKMMKALIFSSRPKNKYIQSDIAFIETYSPRTLQLSPQKLLNRTSQYHMLIRNKDFETSCVSVDLNRYIPKHLKK